MNKYLITIEMTDEQKQAFAQYQGYDGKTGDIDQFIEERVHTLLLQGMLVPMYDEIDRNSRTLAEEQKLLVKQQANDQVTVSKDE